VTAHKVAYGYCDGPGDVCEQTAEFNWCDSDVETIRELERQMRDYGWFVRGRKHYCSQECLDADKEQAE